MKKIFIAILLLLALSRAFAKAETLPRVPQTQYEINLSFAPLVKEAAPAVVNIYASRIVQAQSPFRQDPFFGSFFRDFADPRPRVQNSLGSGVILSDDGIVVSNYHVVGQADQIRVVLNDRREFDARVLLADETADLAVLKLEGATNTPYLRLRDSDTVEVGELVLAIGNPFGVGQTVSSGIVSGLARSGTATGNARGYFIQTDAPINPGNSGGALIDVSGRLIGINTSILTRSGGSNGIGFAIPSALVGQFVAQARAGNRVFERPWAGATGQPVDADLSSGLGLTAPSGIVLSALHPESPLAKAGLEVGDVILSVDGQPVNTPAEMLFRMSVRGIGATISVDYVHQGNSRTVPVDLIAPPETPPRDEQTLTEDEVLTGLAVARINPAVLADLGLPLTATGVVVTDTGRYGDRIGLQRGDILRAINGREITDPEDVGRALRRAGSRIQIEAERGHKRLLLRFRA